MARISGNDALAAFGQHQRRRNLSPGTISKRRQRLIQLAEWLDPVDLLDAETEQIEEWLDSKQVSPQTRYGYVGMLTAFYRWAHREELIECEPTENVVRPQLPVRLPRPMNDDDVAVAAEMADPRMRAWVLLTNLAGCRVAEIADLRVEDIDRNRNMLLVHGKGNKHRVVPLHEDVLAALVRYGLPRSGYIFRRQDGQPMRPSTISFYISTYYRSLGIDATAHQGRHAFATKVYRASGGDLLMTAGLLGHSSPTTTAGYAQWEASKASEVVGRLTLSSTEEPTA